MAKRERDWFPKMAPKGFSIRMMEPGEAPALRQILQGAGSRSTALGLPGPDIAEASLDDFVRWLLAHEIFVATRNAGGKAGEGKAGEPVGFAAARDLVDLYWLSGLYVRPEDGEKGVGRALVSAVARRAGWFFHRAVGLTAYRDPALHESFFMRCGFVTVLRKDFPAILEDRLVAETPAGAREADRVAMVKWL